MGIIFIKNKIQKNKTENKRDKRSFVEFLLHVVAHDVSHVSIPKIKILVIMSRSKKVRNKQLAAMFKERDNISFWKLRGFLEKH